MCAATIKQKYPCAHQDQVTYTHIPHSSASVAVEVGCYEHKETIYEHISTYKYNKCQSLNPKRLELTT